jgi:hypothetical protein
MTDLPEKAHPTPAQGLGEYLMRAMSDPNITAEKLQVLLAAQRDILAERRRESFQTAFAAMSARLPQVTKDGLVELRTKDGRHTGSYRYARWEDMDTVIRPILVEFGFSISFYTKPSEGKIILGGRLMHVDGHFEIAERYLKPDIGPGRNDLQAEGSGQSYAKRYTAEALLNIVRRGEDDDAVGAKIAKITSDQVKELETLCDTTKTKRETFLRLFVTGIESMVDIPARDFARLKNALEEKKASMTRKKT